MGNKRKLVVKIIMLSSLFCFTHAQAQPAKFHVVDPSAYEYLVKSARTKTKQILKSTSSMRSKNLDTQIAYITQQLIDIPYIYKGGMGEGDWQPNSAQYQPGATHIQQNPVYRLDSLDCQTFVQYSMAMLYSKNLDEFDENILKISYGAAGNPDGEVVRFYNRNNFVDADFNPVNQQNGFLKDVTTVGELAPYAKTTSALITRQNWFLRQQKHLRENVIVLNDDNGPAMVKRFNSIYRKLHFPHFQKEKVTISYLPKNSLAFENRYGAYYPNTELLDKIPTPAVAEIIRDIKKWDYNNINIKDLIGTELNVSHFGLLYRQQFKQDELIYRQINCNRNKSGYKTCVVTPVTCKQKTCDELMFAHATDGYPYQFFWYPQANGDYVCTPKAPEDRKLYTTCNRVERIPLFNYITSFQSGRYAFMSDDSILGLHIEQLVGPVVTEQHLSALMGLRYVMPMKAQLQII